MALRQTAANGPVGTFSKDPRPFKAFRTLNNTPQSYLMRRFVGEEALWGVEGGYVEQRRVAVLRPLL